MNRTDLVEMAYKSGVVRRDVAAALVDTIMRVERDACLRIEDEVACSPAMFATMREYHAYAEAVSAYSAAIQARGTQ